MSDSTTATPSLPAPSAFGFRVRSRAKLRFLRSGGGTQALEVVTAREPRSRPEVEPLAYWTLPGVDHEVEAAVYRVNRRFEFWVTDVGAYHIDPEGGRIEIPAADDEILREQRLWGVPATLSYMHRGDVSLHAAAVEIGNGAVLFAAPGKHGKSTLALAFHQQGHRVLSEDLSCCRLSDEPAVIPGPALLRIRTDVYAGEPPPGTHLVVARPDRIYLGVDQDRRGSCAPVPIKAIVFLRESANGLTMETVAPSIALADLWHLSFRLWTNEARARSFQQLSVLAGKVPIFNLSRPLNRASLEPTMARIVEQLGGAAA